MLVRWFCIWVGFGCVLGFKVASFRSFDVIGLICRCKVKMNLRVVRMSFIVLGSWFEWLCLRFCYKCFGLLIGGLWLLFEFVLLGVLGVYLCECVFHYFFSF